MKVAQHGSASGWRLGTQSLFAPNPVLGGYPRPDKSRRDD